MFSVNFFFFILFQYFTYITPQTQIPINISACYPIPLGLNEQLSQYQLQMGCRNLLSFTEELDFRCCELEFQEKKNSSAPRKHGCMAFLSNHIDNDRYEDIIDWIERGKLDKFIEYTYFCGKTIHDNFVDFIKNETKYEVYKLDCFTNYIFLKYFIFLGLLFGLI